MLRNTNSKPSVLKNNIVKFDPKQDVDVSETQSKRALSIIVVSDYFRCRSSNVITCGV